MRRALWVASWVAAAALSSCKCKDTITVKGDAGSAPDAGGRRGDGGILFEDGGFIGSDGGFVLGGGIGPGGFVIGGPDGGGTGVGSGVAVDPDAGGIVLSSQTVQLHYAWIANNAQGWVSKYDSDTGKEVARYYSVVPVDGQGNPVGVQFNDYGNNSPSRTAIDLYGNAWVGNRAFAAGIEGSVTKIANSLSDCVDRNGNGKIDTSQDLNGDGVIDPDPAHGEFIVPSNPADPKTYDECVLFSTPVGDKAAGLVKVRALAISAGGEGTAGDIWVGDFSRSQVLRLSSIDGRVLPVTPQNPNGPTSIQLSWPVGSEGPYGAAVDGLQRLWIVRNPAADIKLALIDTTQGTLVSDQLTPPSGVGANASYGMGVDGKNRVWFAGFSSGPFAFRYDNGPGVGIANGVWTKFDFSAARSATGSSFGLPRGIAADDQGIVWMSGDENGAGAAAVLIGFDGDTGQIKQFGGHDFIDATDGLSSTSIGVGIDSNNNIWVNNYSGNAMRIDRNTGAVLKTQQQPAGLYTYSDFTGYELRHFTAPRGTYQQDLMGCGPQTSFDLLSWDSIQMPPATQIQVFVQVASTVAGLSSAQQFGPFTQSPANLKLAGVPARFQYIRVTFVLLSADHMSTPVLKDFTVTWDCNGQIG